MSMPEKRDKYHIDKKEWKIGENDWFKSEWKRKVEVRCVLGCTNRSDSDVTVRTWLIVRVSPTTHGVMWKLTFVLKISDKTHYSPSASMHMSISLSVCATVCLSVCLSASQSVNQSLFTIDMSYPSWWGPWPKGEWLPLLATATWPAHRINSQQSLSGRYAWREGQTQSCQWCIALHCISHL